MPAATTPLNCSCCNCCHLVVALEMDADNVTSDTFDVYITSPDLPEDLLLGRFTDPIFLFCSPPADDRGIVFVPASFDPLTVQLPDGIIATTDFQLVYTDALDQLAASGACDLTIELRHVETLGCDPPTQGRVMVYAACRREDDTLPPGNAELLTPALVDEPYGGTFPIEIDVTAPCCGVSTPCCPDGRSPPTLVGDFTGSVSATGIVFTYNPTQLTEADTHPWTAEFEHNGHTITAWVYCVPLFDTYALLTWCDLDALFDDFFDAFGSISTDPNYDPQWDLYPPGAPDGSIDTADFGYLLAHLSEYSFGAGGGVTGTLCLPSVFLAIDKTLGGVALPCTLSGADFEVELNPP